MSEQDKTQMAQYVITSSPKTVYHYKEYRYDRLADALIFAKSDNESTKEGGESTEPA